MASNEIVEDVIRTLEECSAGLDLSHPEYYEYSGFTVIPSDHFQRILDRLALSLTIPGKSG